MAMFKLESCVGGEWFYLAGPWEGEAALDAIDSAWDFAYDCDVEVEGIRATEISEGSSPLPVTIMLDNGPGSDSDSDSLDGWDKIDTRTEDDQITFSEAQDLFGL